jgi:hypothetical protein
MKHRAIVEVYLATANRFEADASAERKFCNFFVVPEASCAEHAADLAFQITNAPYEVLTDEFREIERDYRIQRTDIRPRSISVGDSLVISINGKRTELLCCSMGWEEINSASCAPEKVKVTSNPNEITARFSRRHDVDRCFLCIDIDPENPYGEIKRMSRKVLNYEGHKFVFAGWNSDRNEAYFTSPLFPSKDQPDPVIATISK